MMAHLLARLGEAALKPHKLATGVWHKAVLSAKNAARLRKETLLKGRCVAGRGRGTGRCVVMACRHCTSHRSPQHPIDWPLCSEWPYDEPAKVLKRRKPKGHKHDKLKPARWVLAVPPLWSRQEARLMACQPACLD